MIKSNTTGIAGHGLLHTQQLARFVCQADWTDLLAPVQHEAVHSFANWVGCAFGGSSHPAVDSASKALGGLSGSAQCMVLGRGLHMDPLNAVNGANYSTIDMTEERFFVLN